MPSDAPLALERPLSRRNACVRGVLAFARARSEATDATAPTVLCHRTAHDARPVMDGICSIPSALAFGEAEADSSLH
ncbi:hypothetical protein MRX96_058009 [Rhipicephalus microplus]